MNEQVKTTPTEDYVKEYRLKVINGKALMEMELPPLKYTVESILPHGLFILAGGAKVGKSWLAEQISYAVASGGDLWGYRAIKAEVLYLGLEDTTVRLQSRFEKFNAYEGMENIHFVLKANTLRTGLDSDIREYLNGHPDIKLIVIDTLQHIRGNEFSKNIYASDVEFTDVLRKITDEYDLTMLVLTHTNKGKHEDDVSKISGSEGIAGGTDGNWVLTKNKRTDENAFLTISNRDTESFEFALSFNKELCQWQKLDRKEAPKNDKEVILFALSDFLKDSENRHWEGTATDLLTILQEKDFSLSNIKVSSFSKQLIAMTDIMKQNYGISFKKSNRNGKRWISLNYVELK